MMDRNKHKRVTENEILINHNEYYKIMKKFLDEAEGTPYNSPKYQKLRNKYYGEVMDVLVKEQKENKIVRQSGGSEEYFLKFYFIITPEEIHNYKLLSILNYNALMYKVFEDCPKKKMITQSFLGYEFRKVYHLTKFPFMQMECSENDPIKIEGYNEIIDFLIENKFIKEYRTHSIYEKQGLELLKNIESVFNLLFLLPRNKLLFYFRTSNFMECIYGYGTEGRDYIFTRLRNRISRSIKIVIKEIPTYLKEVKFKYGFLGIFGGKRKFRFEKIEELKKLLSDFEERMKLFN